MFKNICGEAKKMNKQSHPETYENYCHKLKRMVTLGWYQKYCECGDEIIGVPEKDD